MVFGQEYWQFPLYSTMNREYSKGTTLYLQEGARPQSTFAGHYDLAAYLVLVLPIIFSLSLGILEIPPIIQKSADKLSILTNLKSIKILFKLKSTYISIFLHLVHILGAWMLVTSGSKTALLAYVVGISIVLLHYLRKLGNLKQQIKWGSLAFITIALSLTIFLNFFAKNTGTKLISLIQTTISSSDIPPNPDATPDDLVGDGFVFKKIVTINEDGTEKIEWREEKSTWSQNALKYGLSMGIRLDTLWPNALKGFVNNPLFGNGYATLVSITSPGEYSTAESTDNNFLRSLGETGIIGFLIFYGFIFVIAYEIYKQKSDLSILAQALRIGFLGSVLGLLINATYIDVFAASKVAYSFWAFAGSYDSCGKTRFIGKYQKINCQFLKHWPIYLTVFLTLFLLHKNPFHQYSLVRNLEVSNQQIESLVTAKCFVETGKFAVCAQNGLILKDNFDLYSILLAPLLKIHNDPMMFYVLNLIFYCISVLGLCTKFLPKLLTKFTNTNTKQMLVFSSMLFYVLILAALEFTNKPLSVYELGVFLFIIPILILIYTVLIHTIMYQLAYLTQICAVLVAFYF
jgi:hypothetical protein